MKTKSKLSRTVMSGRIIIASSIVMGLLYSVVDSYIDSLFHDNNTLREIYEKASVALLFLGFGLIFYWLIRRIRYFQSAVEEREKKYRDYMNLAPDPIIATNKKGDIKEANPAAEALIGYSADHLCVTNITSILSKESLKDAYGFMHELVETKHAVSTLRYVRKDGEKVYLNTNAAMIDEDTYIYICRDITDVIEMSGQIKRLNSELQSRVDEELHKLRKQEYLIESNKKFADMGHMLTAISHQWRQPLNGLGLYIQDIVETYHAGGLDDAYINQFECISKKVIHQMSSTIDDFTTFFSVESNGKEFQVLNEIMDILTILSAQVYYMGVDIRVKCGCDKQNFDCKNIFTCPHCEFKDAYARGNVGKFRQAILNLIYNSLDAVQARKSGEPDYKGSVLISLQCASNISIDIDDNGVGFSEETLKNGFEPQFSAKEDGGTGLGLFTVKMIIVEQMGGTVTLGNIENGARVHIELEKSGKRMG